jgi:hypothetical protein
MHVGHVILGEVLNSFDAPVSTFFRTKLAHLARDAKSVDGDAKKLVEMIGDSFAYSETNQRHNFAVQQHKER